ncbi:MAG TPA: anaerobic ribonucleoside-triphosphate reductase activating protein [Candidatus Paceibacterota bacterium]|nr:anaerobic ribonucleoside-triphosphate reductase activating protein [Candidatus Paceibacterota bacterium]
MKLGGLQPFSLVDYPKEICMTVFTIGCNFRCPYCHNPELVEETADALVSEEAVFERLKSRRGLLGGVTVTGGEPTMHADLPDFIRRIKALGFKVKLDTNGTNPQMVAGLFKDKLLDYVAMDIKAPLRRYQENVGRPVDVRAVRENIERIMGSGVAYEFRTTVVKSMLSFEDFREMGEEIRGARLYALQKFIPTKLLNPQFLKKVSYSDEEFGELRTLMGAYVKECVVRV